MAGNGNEPSAVVIDFAISPDRDAIGRTGAETAGSLKPDGRVGEICYGWEWHVLRRQLLNRCGINRILHPGFRRHAITQEWRVVNLERSIAHFYFRRTGTEPLHLYD